MEPLESAIQDFRSILDRIPQRLSSFSDEQAAAPAAPGHWSRKQILGHLLDSAANNHHRFVRAQIEGELRMPGYAQEAWVSSQHYQDRPWNELVAFWTTYNHHLLHVMERASKTRLSSPCRIGDGAPVTLEFLMTDYVTHLKHHLGQLLPL
jgi:hypothetical protein